MAGFPSYPGGNVLFDPHDANPNHRYKYITNYGDDNKPGTPTTEGMVIYTSSDGKRFTKHEQQMFPYLGDAQSLLLWDHNIGKYVTYLRGSDEPFFEHGGRKVVRGEADEALAPWPYKKNNTPFHGAEGHELPHFSNELPTVMRADESDPWETDLYGSQVFIYPVW